MPSPLLNVVGGVEASSPRSSLNGAPSPSPSPNADVSRLTNRTFGIGSHIQTSPSTPPLLQRPLPYSITLPPTLAVNASPTTQQLPPACGARQLSKLKRFLTTLMQFGDDISADVGDQVRHLILALVNSIMSTEEFHAKLQETTNFPLRPFVIPFLKTNLPFLQRELLHCARLSRQYPDRYSRLSSDHSPIQSHPLPNSVVEPLGPPPTKRPAPSHLLVPPVPPEQHIPPFHGHRHIVHGPPRPIPSIVDAAAANSGDETEPLPVPPPNEGVGNSFAVAAAAAEALVESRDADSPTPHPFEENKRGEELRKKDENKSDRRNEEPDPEMEREIYYVYHLLSTVSVMMEKARLSLEAIKSRDPVDHFSNGSSTPSSSYQQWQRRDSPPNADLDVTTGISQGSSSSPPPSSSDSAQDLSKKDTSDSTTECAPSLPPPTKMSNVIAEVERAINIVEAKTSDLIADVDHQRTKLLKRKLQDANDDEATATSTSTSAISSLTLTSTLQSISTNNVDAIFCWNCGREANETCSGCNKAKYCGSFCQHKDWENHHKDCIQLSLRKESQQDRVKGNVTLGKSKKESEDEEMKAEK